MRLGDQEGALATYAEPSDERCSEASEDDGRGETQHDGGRDDNVAGGGEAEGQREGDSAAKACKCHQALRAEWDAA